MDFPVSQSQLAHLMDAVKADARCAATGRVEEDESQRQLIAALRRFERDALAQLVDLHHQRIARLVQRLSGWSGENDDLVQEVFVAALRGARRFDGRSSVETWLTRIAINACRADRR